MTLFSQYDTKSPLFTYVSHIFTTIRLRFVSSHFSDALSFNEETNVWIIVLTAR